VVRPEDLLKTVKRENDMFRGMSQQDAHEFLGWVLNRVAEEVEMVDKSLRANGQSAVEDKGMGKTFVQNLFEGVLTNETRCLSCETVSSPRDRADERLHLATSSFSTCPSISSSTLRSLHVSAVSPRVRCCVRKISFSAIRAVAFRKQRRGAYSSGAH
jgi:hypothetical protein